ncbi:Na+/H+ antiporter [Oleiharenicola lentus]|uniref:Na+/H+ antiporter n=1 Tax=Oleiharenicola lentus TaxID=2508720 RepID=UPI003F66E82B
MEHFEHALILILLLTALSVVGRWLPWPQPITFAAGGTLAALLPGFPRVELDPGFFFLCFVPPLLFSDGWLMPLRDFLAERRSILLLATWLVVFTTVSVGLVAHWLVPGLPLAMAFALGAVVSPTDAVAVSAITHKLKIPPRLTTILNGESLMNDATGLVAFKFALAAMLAGTFSLKAATLDFLWLAIGGLTVGIVIAYGVGRIRDLLKNVRSSDAFVETSLSLLTPYAAYLAAEKLGLSSILAVVAAGLYSGWRDPIKLSVSARQTSWTVWSVVLFWLNGLAFILLGLQLPGLLTNVLQEFSGTQLLLFTAAVAGTAIISRLVFVFPGAYLPYLLRRKKTPTQTAPSSRSVLAIGWAGMRGTITLAAALSIPVLQADGSPFPGRDIVIFLALGVIVVTLSLQGMTLSSLLCWLKLPVDDTRLKEDRVARIAAVEGGLGSLRSLEQTADSPEEAAALGAVIAEYEHRLAELTAQGETQTSAQKRRKSSRKHRLHALRAERHAVDDLWRRDIITIETHRPLQQLLDYEESLLDGQPEHQEA